jgi:DNA-binding beta-propeller fold protein YncE
MSATLPLPHPIPLPIPIPHPVPAPTQTELQGGLGGAVGCDFNTSHNQLIFVEYSGKLSSLAVAPSTPAYKVLGTGYNAPEDVKLSGDGGHAYVIERGGDLVKVALSSANRSAATVIATGMTAPQQMFLDEAHNSAYVVEYASPGSLLKINLTSGAKMVITAALNLPIGVVLSSDLQYAYVSDQAGPIRSF